jgi:hypothetical protein
MAAIVTLLYNTLCTAHLLHQNTIFPHSICMNTLKSELLQEKALNILGLVTLGIVHESSLVVPL